MKSIHFTDKQFSMIPPSAIELIRLLKHNGYEAYLVGGCVRDMLLNIPPNDWDICTNATPTQMLNLFTQNHIYYHTTGIEYGTVTAIMSDDNYEITTYRKDMNYSDNRHPDNIEFALSIEADLARRDFTINSMAYDPLSDSLKDPYHGAYDLMHHRLETVSSPYICFQEDALRIIRAIRFAIKYELFISEETSIAMDYQKDNLDSISKERITSELEKILTYNKPITKYFLKYANIITKLIPDLAPCVKFEQNNKYHKHDIYEHMLSVVDNCDTTKFEIKLAALLHDIGKPLAYSVDENGHGHFYGHPKNSVELCENHVFKNDLRLSNEQKKLVLDLIENHDLIIAETKPAIKRVLNRLGESTFRDWFILKQADIDDHIIVDEPSKNHVHVPIIKEIMEEILKENECFKVTDLKINGYDIINLLNIKPGREVGEILHQLFEEVMDETLENDPDILKNRVLEITKNNISYDSYEDMAMEL